MIHRRLCSGVACCFILFIAVFLLLKSPFVSEPVQGNEAEPGLLWFMLPGMIAGLLTRRGQVTRSLAGAFMALPVCFLVAQLHLLPARPLFQELAWLCSAVFWCSVGALLVPFIRAMRRHVRRCRRHRTRFG
ncbi:inner membrane protein YbjM [Erwinia sp. HR93]|uniref:inner membrane protein YbjM n=1 Tax=Erwinia sp. HR93 TaxID=3094840 RepID=UPI002ADEF29F|nr:inner membrane protein YbjM [Erwinia sp. HR93]MEA1064597.1 inner membrane protein YbjM [Erwinia sp. HR93]